jgi:hypothetical protein
LASSGVLPDPEPLLCPLAHENAAMNVEVERVDGSKTQEKSRYGGRDAAELLGLGSISKQIVANRTPLANPSAMDMKRLVGLRQSARSPPTGEAIAAGPTTDTTWRRSADTSLSHPA